MPLEAVKALAKPGEWKGHRRTVQALKGLILFYFVQFDEPIDDGSGDGPYFAAEIDESSLLRCDSNA